MDTLAAYLQRHYPSGMNYPDAAQLCLRLYCTADGVPPHMHSELTMQGLANTFAELAQSGWVHQQDSSWRVTFGAHFHEVSDRGHWIEVMASIFKLNPGAVDRVQGEALAMQVGFRSSQSVKPVP